MTEVRPIGDLIETLIDYRGRTPPKTDKGVPLITAKVIKGGRIVSNDLEFIAEESYDAWMRRGLPRPGDILITTEAPLGEVAQIGKDPRVALAQRVILLRPDRRKIDPQFLFHYLRAPEAQARLRRRASGTTVSGIRQPELRAVEVSLLRRSDQEKVGRILDALDDLIENNRRRIELLEQMAQAIYREWFVCFRYPGHQDSALVDSPQGPIPEGWEVKTLGEISTNFDRLRKPMSKARRGERVGKFPYYGAAKLIDWVDGWIFDGEYLLFAEDGSVLDWIHTWGQGPPSKRPPPT